MDQLFPDHSERHKVRVLDVAAGTGLTGVEVGTRIVQRLGFGFSTAKTFDDWVGKLHSIFSAQIQFDI